MKALPIRLRLSLWYFALFSTAACLLSAASWWMLQHSLDSTEYHDLQERAEDVQLLLLNQEPNAGVEAIRQEFAAMYSIKDDGKWLQVMDQDGAWLFRSKRMIAENPVLPPPDSLPSQEPSLNSARAPVMCAFWPTLSLCGTDSTRSRRAWH